MPLKTNEEYKKPLTPGRAADSGFKLGSSRLPSCFRAVCAWPDTAAICRPQPPDISFSRGIDLIAFLMRGRRLAASPEGTGRKRWTHAKSGYTSHRPPITLSRLCTKASEPRSCDNRGAPNRSLNSSNDRPSPGRPRARFSRAFKKAHFYCVLPKLHEN